MSGDKAKAAAWYDVTYTNQAGTRYTLAVPKVALAKFVKDTTSAGGTILSKRPAAR